MKKTGTEGIQKGIISGTLVVVLVLTAFVGADFSTRKDAKAGTGTNTGTAQATVTEELTAKRSKFVKQFALSDGSFTATIYSMPIHYKKNGRWKEINTTLVKSGKTKYKTKATDLSIKVSKKANKKSVVSLKRGKTSLSIALKGKKLKQSKAKISNPKKTTYTDVLNQNKVTYKKVLKNTNVSYDIFPEKVQEIVTVSKKQKNKSFSFKLNTKLKVKVKGKKVYFKTKKGKTKFTRMSTKITDANGVSTTNVKLFYNKKTKTLKVTPNKKWWNSKKRKFPVEIRTTYLTDKHRRDVKVGAAYAGAPNSNFGYDKSLLLQANKCVAFTKMSTLSELKNQDVQIRDAALHIKNEKTIKLGAGKTFDIGVHKVTQNWNVNKLTYNNRPAYEAGASATVGIQKAGKYQCDVTDIVRAWYAGEANYGVALVADNSNRSYQAKIDRNPYFTVHYEVVGFDGAVELKGNAPVTRSVIKAGQENYYYFDTKLGIAYDIYTDSSIDTQATMYDTAKNQVAYDDNSGLDNNFLFTGAYNGRKYLKVSVKNKGTGDYTLTLKKHFAIPEPTGIKGQDKYTITWNAVENAKEYLICVYDGGKKINDAVVTGTSYDYIYNNETAGKTLGFTVTARENASLAGEASRMVYNTDSRSEWVYTTPMQETRKNASAAALDGKIYVLGGENATGSLKTFAVYDTEKKTWESLPEYPGTESGICRAAVFAYNNEIYVIGGQTDTGVTAKLLKSVYAYNTETRQWQKKADLAEGRTNLAYACSKDKIYVWSKAGTTDQAEIYDIKTDTWETAVLPDTSAVIAAASVDNRVFVLKEDGEKMFWQEYLPEDNLFEDVGTVCPFAASDIYGTPVVISGKIYMAKTEETKEVLVYDAYSDEWSRISDMNLTKKDSMLAASGNDIYSIGGELAGFGVLDTVEQYTVKVQTTTKQMAVNQGESYELQVNAGNLKKGQAKIVTVNVNPEEMKIQNASSFETEDTLKEGADGVTLLKYQPKKGVIVLKLTGSLERGGSYETYQSIPVEAKITGKTTVEITLTEEKIMMWGFVR
ncbi:MAG: DNRLRE domain-containing protein [Clostridium sp.]